MDRQNNDGGGWELLAVFRSSKSDTFFLTIIAGIENTERVASDFSNALELSNKSSVEER